MQAQPRTGARVLNCRSGQDLPFTDRRGGISIHAVDIAYGRPAAGLHVTLVRIEGSARMLIAEGEIAAGGLLDHPIREGTGIAPGLHEADFDIGAYYGSQGIETFLAIAPFRFVMPGTPEHVHLPLKFTPSGLMVFRGV